MASAVIHDRTTNTRHGFVSGLWPKTTYENPRKPREEYLYYEAAAYLALEHFNSRNGAVLPEIPDLLAGCDFTMEVEFRDTRFRPFKGVEEALDSYRAPGKKPFAVWGPYSSSVSLPVSIVTSGLEIPTIGTISTSQSLDNSPFYARTCTSVQSEAKIFLNYLNSIGVPRIGILYSRNEWGLSFHNFLIENAPLYNVTVATSVGYVEGHNKEEWILLKEAMKELAQSKVQYFVGIVNPPTWKHVAREGFQHGIMGAPGYTWYFSELEMTRILDKETEGDIAQAVHGSAVTFMHFEDHPAFDQHFEDFLLARGPVDSNNRTMRDRYIASQAEQKWARIVDYVAPVRSSVSYLAYDAMMALGIAACKAPEQFAGQQLYDALVRTEFQGVTGWVAFDHNSGTRREDTVHYRLENVVLADKGKGAVPNSSFVEFNISTVAIVGTETINFKDPYTYSDNSTNQPSPLPPVDGMECNLIDNGALIYGWVFAAFVALMSLGWMVWTVLNRKRYVVGAGQPVFLCQLCLGTFLTAMAVIPLSMQEEREGCETSKFNLDAACMATPWIVLVGFCVAFSATISKAMRLNMVIRNGQAMRRVKVSAMQVQQPLCILLLCNTALLLSCTLIAPFKWSRVPVPVDSTAYDEFGRLTETYGSCGYYTPSVSWYFIVPLGLINLAGVGYAAYQCYLQRDVTTDMSETTHLFVSIVSMFETTVIFGPLLFVVKDNPTRRFLLESTLVDVACLTLLLPIFIPKYQQRFKQLAHTRPSKDILKGNSSHLGGCQHSARSAGGGTSSHEMNSYGPHSLISYPAVDKEADAAYEKVLDSVRDWEAKHGFIPIVQRHEPAPQKDSVPHKSSSRPR
ncbi:Gamma-aminobutyric acid (GABA) B receptor [Seminavis robusta]|uniref:Gamma-aminobutyric acid (GABA) B receptor n=1 Tax=Seminavis robusta TaxID=568900 RepID=A0A9N8DXM4_9STRA|nr:Gamma-aminobutyric acid (GABA) B receptor [Seminavis robusta]|eukprot:Sro433_g141780.1 Gamma-aminobutyric acid (GABA) B receptor (853) ;mRNA; f:13953-17037